MKQKTINDKLFAIYKIQGVDKKSFEIKGEEYKSLIDGYLDNNIKLSVLQNKATKSLCLAYMTGPKYCPGSTDKTSKLLDYPSYRIPKKYKTHFTKLKMLYNDHLEVLSKTNQQTYLLI